MKNIIGKYFCIIFSAVFLIAGVYIAPIHAQSEETKITGIRIEGAQRIDSATVETYSGLIIGDRVSVEELNRALEQVYSTGLFEDVLIELEGSVLVITIEENPIINRVSLEGNDALDDDRLLALLDIRPRRVFTEKLALDAKSTLMNIYRQSGRYAAVIEPKIIELSDKRVDLVFEIDEGPLIKITRIKFIGNEVFSDRALKGIIESRETKWYIPFGSDDKYDAGRLTVDEQQLRQFYLENGYADVNIVRSTGELLSNRSGFVLTFQIDEGSQYTVADIELTSEIEGLDTQDLLTVSTIEVGETYDTRVLEESLSQITAKLGEFGYAFVDVRPEIDIDREASTLDITINVGEAQRNYVEQINIRGNDRTLDRVIRRRFELVEGDSFNHLRLTRSERNVRNLGYFSDVEFNVLPGSRAEQSVIDVAVEERSTGNFNIGLGYSTFDKTELTFGIIERNFLGTGRGVRANASLSGGGNEYRLGITEPYFLDRDLFGSFDIFKQETEYTSVEIERQGAEVNFGFSAADNYRHGVGYLLADVETRTTSTSTRPRSISGDEGSKLISEVSYTLTKDTRDSRIDPRNGYLLRARNSLAGLGGDLSYVKTVLRGQYLQPVLFSRLVIGLDSEFGYVDGLNERVARSSRFLLGGRKVRGFASAGIGPRDSGDDSAVGGNQYYTASLNFTSDLGLNKDLGMRWTLFADAGSVWGTDYPENVIGPENNSLRSSVGYGIFWDTVVGPMSFIWAHALEKEDYDETRIFQFSFGGRF